MMAPSTVIAADALSEADLAGGPTGACGPSDTLTEASSQARDRTGGRPRDHPVSTAGIHPITVLTSTD
jgi:hypothetical protein